MPPFNFEHLPLQRPLHGPAAYIKTRVITIGYGPRSVAEKLLCGLNSVVGFTMEDKLFIDKLSRPENWATKGLWGIVMETEVLAADANANARAEFQRRKEKAFSVLVLNVSTPQLYLITSCQTPKEAWDTLRGHFEHQQAETQLLPHGCEETAAGTMIPLP